MSANYENELIALRTGKNPPERSGECWAKDELEQLKLLYYSGAGFSEIALKLKRTEVAVFQQATKIGLLSQQCKPRKRTPKQSGDTACLCPGCTMTNCPNYGKECPCAGEL